MKVTFILLLALLFSSTFANEEVSEGLPEFDDSLLEEVDENGVKVVAEIIAGTVVGAIKHHTSIQSCFHDTKGMLKDFSSAVSSFKNHSKKGIVGGLKHVGGALKKLPDAIKHCKLSSQIKSMFKKAATRFSEPEILVVIIGKNIIWHHKAIHNEINGMRSAYAHKKWFKFGEELGKMIDTVVLSLSEELPEGVQEDLENTGSDFIKGFAHGVSPSAYGDVSKCIHDVSKTTWNRIEKDVKDLSWKHIERSVKDIEDIGKVFVGIVKDCKTGSKAVKTLVDKLSHAFTGKNFINAAINIIKHPLKFAQKVERTQKDFKSHKFYAAGDEIGSFVGEVLHLRFSNVEELLKETM